MNVATHIDNINSFGQFAGFYGIGAAAGAAGAGVGLGVSSVLAGGSFLGGVMGTSTVVSTGFASGFVSGAAGGFTGGFVNGFGNAAMKPGNDFGDMLGAGWDFGWKGALFGGVAGGITGGIDAVNHDRNFWTGSGKQYGVIKLNTDGTATFCGEDDFKIKPYGEKVEYGTQLNNNSSITISNDGKVTVKVPNNVNRINGIVEVSKTTSIDSRSFLQGRRFISFTTSDVNGIEFFHGYRYWSNPFDSFRDLFHYRGR